MSYIVRIKPCNQTIVVDDDETVLDAALRCDIDFPFSCMSAICTTCLGKLIQGDIAYINGEPYGLEDVEPNQGYALFCSAMPKSDLVIEVNDVISDDDYPSKKLHYHLKKLESLNEKTHRVILAPPADDRIKYRPGQYVHLFNQKNESAPFTIANAPQDNGDLEFHVQTGTVFADKFIIDLQKNPQVIVEGPHGQNVYQCRPSFPILLLSGGVGISHSMAILQYASTLHFPRPVHLYWGCKKIEDFYLLDEIKKITHDNFQFTPILLEPNDDWQEKTGLIHPAVLEDYPDLTNIEVHASGSSEMVQATFEALQPHGLRQILMHSDYLAF